MEMIKSKILGVKIMARETCKTINGKLCITTAVIADILGVEDRTIQQWGDKGCPKEARGWWSIKDMLRWRGMVGEGEDKEESISLAQQKLEAEIKFKQNKAEESEFKNQIRVGEYIRKDEITHELSRLLTILKKSMNSYSRKVANEISAFVDPVTARRIEKMVSELSNDALEQISITGVYEPNKKKKSGN